MPQAPTRRRPRLALAALVTACVLAAPVPVLATPVLAATAPVLAAPRAAPAAVTTRPPAGTRESGGRTVRLITGQQVRLSSLAGRPTARFVGPDAGEPRQVVHLGSDLYVVPSLTPRMRRVLDPSVFNVTALAEAQERSAEPYAVSFAPGTSARSVGGAPLGAPGRLRAPTERRRLTDADLTEVVKVTGPRPSVTPAPRPGTRPQRSGRSDDYVLHRLTLTGTDRAGAPLDTVFMLVNLEDAGYFGAFTVMIDGTAKVMVPNGPYLLIASHEDAARRRSVVTTTFTVSGDTSRSFSLRQSTVRHRASVPGRTETHVDQDFACATKVWGQVNDVGVELKGAVSAWVNPTPERWLRCFTYTYGSRLAGTPAASAAYTRDVWDHQPARPVIAHPLSDFTTVEHRFFGTGQRVPATSGVLVYNRNGFAPDEFTSTVRTQSRRSVLLQRNPAVRWLNAAQLRSASGQSVDQLTELVLGRSSPARMAVDFFRGPVGPGFDRGGDTAPLGDECTACVRGGAIQLALPMYASAGATMNAWGPGSWSLSSGARRIASGTYDLYLSGEPLGDVSQGLRLDVTNRARIRGWVLSNPVTASFTVPRVRDNAYVPFLRASWAPPVRLSGSLAARRVRFPVSLDNYGPEHTRVATLRVSYAADSGAWRPARVTRTGPTTFAVSYPNPRGTYVHLRVSARDVKGRTYTETVRRAYRRTSSSTSTFTTRAAARGQDDRRSTRPAPGHRLDQRSLCRGRTSSASYGCYVHVRSWGALAAPGRSPSAAAPAGWGAKDLRSAYAVPASASRATVAVVVAYDYPSAEADLGIYRRRFGLPACTTANGCFRVVDQRGRRTRPAADENWAVEAALDLQMVSAGCPTCRILLVEADSPTRGNLEAATRTAARLGASVSNHSYGGDEQTGAERERSAYRHVGMTAVAASGDFGYTVASTPASFPEVVAVGGTVLARDPGSPRRWSDTAWEGSGSGCSAYFDKPTHQKDTACPHRTIADLSAAAVDLAVYDSFLPAGKRGWITVSGTSASSPFVAGLIAAAGQGGMGPERLYSRPGAFLDVTQGANGYCKGNPLCTARPGWDGPSGLGVPRGLQPFRP